MLVLARRSGESIRIGEDIEITIRDLKNGKATIVVQAPGKSIRRGELPEPRSVFVPQELIGVEWHEATDLPIFEHPKEIGNYLTQNQNLIGRRIKWEESTDASDIERYRLQRLV